MTAPAGGGPAVLDLLAVALGSQFSTTLVRRAGHRPRMIVADRQTGAATEVYADDAGRLWWPWAEPAAVTTDPLATAHHLTAVLRGTPPRRQR